MSKFDTGFAREKPLCHLRPQWFKA